MISTAGAMLMSRTVSLGALLHLMRHRLTSSRRRREHAKKGTHTMHQADQQAHEPKGPTTGPLRPVIVVMDTIDDEEEEEEEEEEEDPRLDAGTPPPPQGEGDDEEQDRLPPVAAEEEGSVPPPRAQPKEPDEPDDAAPITPGPSTPRDPRPPSLPPAAARPRRRLSLLIALIGISLMLLGVAVGVLLVVSPARLGSVMTLIQ